jgi:hypothetical protein
MLKQSGAFGRNRAFHKRRDEFVDYVEKAIKLHHRLGHRESALGGGGGGGKKGK